MCDENISKNIEEKKPGCCVRTDVATSTKMCANMNVLVYNHKERFCLIETIVPLLPSFSPGEQSNFSAAEHNLLLFPQRAGTLLDIS